MGAFDPSFFSSKADKHTPVLIFQRRLLWLLECSCIFYPVTLKILDRLVIKGRIERLGFLKRDPKVFAFEVGEEDQFYIETDDIPKKERENIIQNLKQANMQITDNNIRAAYTKAVLNEI